MQRYYSLRRHFKEVFGHPVLKICVDAGFTCPNRNGSKGIGGCIYCNERGSGAPYIDVSLPVEQQIIAGIKQSSRRAPDTRYIVYFQPFSNTYAPVDYLRYLYENAQKHEEVIGLSIGTRPDCVSPGILDLLAELSQKIYIWLEYGVETIHDRTLHAVNRKHKYTDFLEAYSAAKKRGIRICLHVIIGLPGESPGDILETAQAIGKLEPDGIKIHSLYIEAGTALFEQYNRKPWPLMDMDEYCTLAARFLEYLPEKCVIQRLVGEGIADRLIAPQWAKNKQLVINTIHNKLRSWNSFQGARFTAP